MHQETMDNDMGCGCSTVRTVNVMRQVPKMFPSVV
jgi:hypothetical protein